jgi:drug/metabolite transporter (DMT)-like permease
LSAFVLAAVLLGAFFHASWNAIVKAQRDRSIASEVVGMFAGLFGLPLMIALPLPAPESWPYLAASALIHVGYFALVGFAYRSADLGVAYPLTRGSAPLLTAAAALLLIGESPHWSGWLAIVIIASGILTLSLDALLRGGLTRHAAFAVMTNALVIVSYTLVDGIGSRKAGDSLVYTAWLTALTALSVFCISWAVRRQKLLIEAKKIWRPALAGGALLISSYGIALWAMTRAPIGLVAALRETSVLFAMLMGIYFFREPFGKRRLLAVVLIVAGIIVLKLPVH